MFALFVNKKINNNNNSVFAFYQIHVPSSHWSHLCCVALTGCHLHWVSSELLPHLYHIQCQCSCHGLYHGLFTQQHQSQETILMAVFWFLHSISKSDDLILVFNFFNVMEFVGWYGHWDIHVQYASYKLMPFKALWFVLIYDTQFLETMLAQSIQLKSRKIAV